MKNPRGFLHRGLFMQLNIALEKKLSEINLQLKTAEKNRLNHFKKPLLFLYQSTFNVWNLSRPVI